MAAYTVARAANKTLTTTAVDAVTLSEPAGRVLVLNRSTTPNNVIWVSFGKNPADPVAAADEVIPLAANQYVTVAEGTPKGFIVKVVGNGEPYSVLALPRR